MLEDLPGGSQGSSAEADGHGKASNMQRRAAPSREHKASLVVFSKANQTASEEGLLERKSLARRLAYRETKGDFSRFVKALREGDSMAVKALGGVTDAAGGFLVPTEHLAVLARIVEEYGWGRRLATIVPMANDTLNVPKLSTAVTASWVAEAAAAPDADPAFAQKQLTAKEGRFKTIISNALLEDSSPAIDAILLDLFGEAWAKMEDEAVFNGAGTGDSDPFTGVLNDTDVNSVAAAGTTLAYDDLVALEAALTGGARRNAWIYVSRKGFKHLRLIKDTNGQPLWTDNIQDGTLGMVLGYPVAVLEAGIPDNLGTGTDETVFILGSLKNVYVGDRAAFSVKSSEHVRFENDQTVIMGRVREAITVVNPEGFAKLTGVEA
jgi:HK97 family phage major capsid protein